MKKIRFLLLLIISSCALSDEGMDMNTDLIPDGFDFATTENKVIEINALDNRSVGISGVPIKVFTVSSEGKTLIGSGQTDQSGSFQVNNAIGNHIDSITVETSYIGIQQSTTRAMSSDISFTFGGESSYVVGDVSSTSSSSSGRTSSDFLFLGSYDGNGVPFYLEPVNDYISQDILDLINNTLPERYPVPTFNPEYIEDDVSSDTQLTDSAEVWVTFVHEGAGWRNALGYYTYDLDNPPTSLDDITRKIIFPNVSFVNGGGGLESGNKVSLGTFPPNTGIGWFLIPQGWSGSGVNNSNQIKYSNKDFNTFTAEEFRTHTVLLKDETREILLLGMEDISRPGGDNDFNDAVFYVTANPFEAIVTDNLQETKTDEAQDSDGDGVSDINDNYPDDPGKAFDVFTPGEDVFGSLAFEDLYPSKGDFDMNDLVIDYNFQMITNVANQVVELKARYKLKALGAMIHSGFGFTLPIDPSKISSISGQDVVENDQVILSSNGTESGQTQATILLFEDAFRSWESAFGRTNTISTNGYVEPKEYEVTITFTEPISNLNLGYAPYDPFIFHSEDRGVEIHLSSGTPTDKAVLDFEFNDDRKEGTNYQTYDGLPYGVNLPVSFDYPEEEESMSDAFNHFDTWAQSVNTTFRDWYLDQSGYRAETKIYKKD